MTARHIVGNLLDLAMDGEFDVVIHGCNCMCRMGKGIALEVRQRFPEAHAADVKTKAGDRAKLGTFSSAGIVRGVLSFTVVNAYTQFDYRGGGVKADYDAIRAVMTRIKADFAGKRIGYPKIGAGLAGGDWGVIKGIIDDELSGEDHTYVEWSGR